MDSSDVLERAQSKQGFAGSGARAAARVRSLSLQDFRSYTHLRLPLDGRPVVFFGTNGAGKTNLLEAVSLIGPGRGLRSARLDELPRVEGAGGWAVSATITTQSDEMVLGVGVDPATPGKRQCRIDRRPASGPGAFSAHIRMLWLTPAQDRLFMDGASERRRFIDRMALAHDPAHGKAANAYEKAMRQRQRVLDERPNEAAWLSALEEQMAAAGVAVAAARREIAGILSDQDPGSGFPQSEVALDGFLENALTGSPAVDVEDMYAERLRENRALDAKAGRALLGPHRSDLLVSHCAKGRPARLCSTGEQKALLIGLVLANARALAARPGGAPLVVLLDEIAAHLDDERRAQLFDVLDLIGFQTFMTGTDKELFSAWGDRAQAFSLRGGDPQPEDLF
ncbi:MAG: DNA replication/repair protein RecF [Pseudomonadota bacterium]